jgi:uncharacterized protein DUF5631/uncharacterized protein DUF5632
VAIFGRNTARQRLRRATRESLKIPAFSSLVDCTPWVTGGLWPAELSTVTAETAPLVQYLKADLQRIVDSANDELTGIRRGRMADSIRQAEEARVINGARAFAVRRVESTVRHLRKVAREFPAEYRPMHAAGESDKTQRFVPPAAEPDTVEPAISAPMYRSGSDDTEVLEEIATVFTEIALLGESPVEEVARRPSTARHAVPPVDEAAAAGHSQPVADPLKPLVEPEPDRERLEQLIKFVARQEPGLCWAVGNREDGATVLATDLAHGWIPPGITLPAGVRLLAPERRTGKAAALLGRTTVSVTYSPGDRLGWATDHEVTDTSSQPRELPVVEDLGWVLSEATHWRDGLPRMVHTLAKAGAAGTGVVEEEIELLRVHVDTARYQLLAQYPDADAVVLLNCLLLAATEGIASGNLVVANYHFAWFQMLSAPPVSGWKASR